ncbi:HEAT repeat domain-containing protein [Pelagicoccus sp. SDUM812005]|uniref:HEAT repeat domain-containing protein n=1 Tax=Pelagicoccus sp. SDUM812005 TaxID=3041257 RepID=UPI00280D12E8|nr:HEAT repeat domain-containing protein [Pelagicoccus sp. SDUM812005]MDQ8183684.1 HEAT repeat domain-containing protein [Pelagicoccus sp. SDUM812005]
MNFYTNLSLKSLAAGVALLALPLSYSQIPEQDLESIFSRLNGDDYDARYEAKMDLQDAVSQAGAPGNEDQPALVEAQLLERLESETLLTTQLWILRQLQLIGSEASIAPLERLLSSDSRELVDAVKTTLSALSWEPSSEESLVLSNKLSELQSQLKKTDNEAIKSAIFAKIAAKSPKAAEVILRKSPLPEYIRIAATSGKGRLLKATLGMLSSGDVAQQIVVVGALQGKVSPKVEDQLIALLSSENETLQLQVLEALGRVGTAKSLDAVLALSDSRSKDLSETAIDTLASIQDPRLDRNLFAAARKGEAAERAKALKAMSYRASSGIAELVNEFAADASLDVALREEAIASMERIGNTESHAVLVSIVLDEKDSGLRKEAQKILKRMTLRVGDPAAAWSAFQAGFERADTDGKLALMLVADSAPTQEMVDYLVAAYESGDESIQKMVMRILPSWRNWDGGEALLAIAKQPGADDKLREQCFKGIGRIILGSDSSYSIEGKYDLAGAALTQAQNDAEKQAVLGGFRYVSWKDKRYVQNDGIHPELKELVENSQVK